MTEKPGRKRSPEASRLIVMAYLASEGWRTPQHRVARNACLKQLDAAKTQLTEGRLLVMFDSEEGGWWGLPKMKEILRMSEFFGIQTGQWWCRFRIAHNLPAGAFQIFRKIYFKCEGNDLRGKWLPEVTKCFTLSLKAGLANWAAVQFPVGRDEQRAWVLECLMHSTRGFAKPGVAHRVCDEVNVLLVTMESGREKDHLL